MERTVTTPEALAAEVKRPTDKQLRALLQQACADEAGGPSKNLIAYGRAVWAAALAAAGAAEPVPKLPTLHLTIPCAGLTTYDAVMDSLRDQLRGWRIVAECMDGQAQVATLDAVWVGGARRFNGYDDHAIDAATPAGPPSVLGVAFGPGCRPCGAEPLRVSSPDGASIPNAGYPVQFMGYAEEAAGPIHDPDPADIIAGALQTSRAHAYELMLDAVNDRYGPPTVDDDSQHWAGMDGAIAFHLIDRHADNWSDTGKMMNEWLAANAARGIDRPAGLETEGLNGEAARARPEGARPEQTSTPAGADKEGV